MLLQLNYFIIYLFLILGFIISLLMIGLNYAFGPHAQDYEKLSAYECGFIPFEDARVKFNVHFYLVGILFIIFDLEIAYLFPWASVLGCLSLSDFYVVMVFLIILTLGFIYEIFKGALDWSIISLN